MVMYGSIAGISIGSLFMAGVIPGIMMGIALMIVSYIYAKKRNIPKDEKMVGKEKYKTIFTALGALLMPVIIIGGTMSGVYSPSEAGMVACFYGIIVGKFVYKGLKFKELPKAFSNAALAASTILFMNGMANIMGWELARVNFPKFVISAMTSVTKSSIGMLLIVVAFLTLLGMFMETTAAIVIFAPVLYPLASMYGVDPIHFGLLIILTLVIGQVTPPVGVLLSTTSSLIGIPMSATFKFLWPCLISLCIVLLLCVFIPGLSLWIPALVFG